MRGERVRGEQERVRRVRKKMRSAGKGGVCERK